MDKRKQVRTYDPAASIVFLKTKERFGGLSNMASGFPLKVNGIRIRTSEALYQASRFPHRPDVQSQIIEERSPMTAKMRSKPYLNETRSDWYDVRVKIMRWCLRVKLAQNWCEFGRLLQATADFPIVEQSRKDDFWGAKTVKDGSTLLGMNVLGRLLMELRKQLNADTSESLKVVKPLSIPEFLLCRKPIETVCDDGGIDSLAEIESRRITSIEVLKPRGPLQPSLFNQPTDVQVQTKITNDHKTLLKPYPLYKHSGVHWLGRVPEHWKVTRMEQLGTFSKGRGGSREDEASTGIPCVRYGDMYTTHQYFIRRSRAFISRMTAKDYTPIKYGDVLFAASGETIDEIGKSAVSLIQSEAYCGGDVILFRPNREVEARFMGYATDCMSAANQKASMGRGVTVIHIYTDQLKHLSLALPPLPEQAAIIRYLDHADRHIQRYIRTKQKLLQLLEEQKKAIIHQAVTGQVDVQTGKAYQAYKPSGVEWLEDVPDHWAVRRLKQSATLIMGQSPSSDDCSDVPIGPPFLQGCAEFGTHHPNSVQYCRTPSKLSPAGAILISVRAPVGRLNISDREYGIGRGLCAILPNNEVLNARLAQYQLEVLGYGLNMVATGSTYKAVSVGDLGNHMSILPPSLEQNAIVSYLNKVTAAIDTTINLTRRQIKLVQEYHTRLINDAVTGKLDVRGVASLPSDMEQLIESDDVTGRTNSLG